MGTLTIKLLVWLFGASWRTSLTGYIISGVLGSVLDPDQVARLAMLLNSPAVLKNPALYYFLLTIAPAIFGRLMKDHNVTGAGSN